MNKLRIPLSAVTDGEKLTLDERVSESSLRPKDSPASTLTEVRVAGTLSAVHSEFLFQGALHGVYERECDRCLRPAREEVDLEIAWFFEPGIETSPPQGLDEYTEEDAFEEDVSGQRVRFFEGDALDLTPHIWEEMVLAAPNKFYCRESCKGLCPQCGIDLNEGACDCAPEQETSNSGLAALKDMFPSAQPETSEE